MIDARWLLAVVVGVVVLLAGFVALRLEEEANAAMVEGLAADTLPLPPDSLAAHMRGWVQLAGPTRSSGPVYVRTMDMGDGWRCALAVRATTERQSPGLDCYLATQLRGPGT